jgi:hypothetical protein
VILDSASSWALLLMLAALVAIGLWIKQQVAPLAECRCGRVFPAAKGVTVYDGWLRPVGLTCSASCRDNAYEAADPSGGQGRHSW